MNSLHAILSCLSDKLEAATAWEADARDPFSRPYRADCSAPIQAAAAHPHDWRRFTLRPLSLTALETNDLDAHRFESECLLDIHYPATLTASLLTDLLTTEASLIRSLLDDSAAYPSCLLAAWLHESEVRADEDGVLFRHHLSIQFEHQS